MPLTKLTAEVNNIQALADRPTETATQLKVIFDKAAADIKAYLNDTLTVEADATFATKDEVADIYAGGVADGSVTDAKLSNAAEQIKDRVATHLADDVKHINPLVQAIVVESDVTQVAFTNLDGNADGGYFLVAEIEDTIRNNLNYYIFVENDLEPSNYSSTSALGGATPADGSAVILGSLGSNTGFIDINRSNTGAFNVISLFNRIMGQLNIQCISKKSAIPNITRLDIVSTDANGIGAGSRFMLYRRKKDD